MSEETDRTEPDRHLSDEDRFLRLRAKSSPAYVLREELFRDPSNLELRQQYLAVRTLELARRDAKQAFAAQVVTLFVNNLAFGLVFGMVGGVLVGRFSRPVIVTVQNALGLEALPSEPFQWIAHGGLLGGLFGTVIAVCSVVIVAFATCLGFEKRASRLQRQIGPLPWPSFKPGTPTNISERLKQLSTSGPGDQSTPRSAAEYAAKVSIGRNRPKPSVTHLGLRVWKQPWIMTGSIAWVFFAIAEALQPATPTSLWGGLAGFWAFCVLSDMFMVPAERFEGRWYESKPFDLLDKVTHWLLYAVLPANLLARNIMPVEWREALGKAVEASIRQVIGE